MTGMRNSGFSASAVGVATLLAASLFAGCSTMPDVDDQPTLDEAQDRYVDSWNDVQAIEYRPARQSLRMSGPSPLPGGLFNQSITLEMDRIVDIQDISFILRDLSIPTMIQSGSLADLRLHLPQFKGSVGSLLAAISASEDISFNWTGNVLIIAKQAQYILRVPQQEEVVTAITETLQELGANSVIASQKSGTLSYRASRQQQKVIELYLDKLTRNTAIINLQLAVINVKLDNETGSGFDWSSLSVKSGDLGIQSDYSAPDTTGNLIGLTSKSLGLSVAQDSLSLTAALNLLSTYGTSQTAQNLTLKTMSGLPVSIRSGDNTPYIDDVSVSSTSETVSGGATTKVLETGFEAKVSPYFDAEEEAVTLSMELNLETLIGFRQLSAGNQLGTIERPETQEQDFNSTVRLEAGETALVGGLIYESLGDNRTSLHGLESFPVGSKKLTVSKNAMFILLRPTVTVYGQSAMRGDL